jgi:two-component sensor histidine kinase
MASLAPLAPALDARTLLREQHHRINNEYASAINLVAVAAVRTANRDVKAALCDVVELLHEQADVHRALTVPDRDVLIEAAEYLRRLSLTESRSKLSRMNIHLLLSTETLPLEAERCWLLGLIVHELVANAVRHACFDGRDGELKIKLTRAGSWVNCRVTDNGSGLGRIKPGRGLRIVGELAKSLGGRMGHTFGTTWTSFPGDAARAAREPRDRSPSPQKWSSIEGHAAIAFRANRGPAGESHHCSATALDRRRHTMSAKTLLNLSARVLLGAVIVAPSAALAQLPGPPPGPPPGLAGPPPGLAAGGPPLGGPPAGPFAGLPPRGPLSAPPRDVAGGPSRLDGAAGLHGLDRGQANFRGVEARAAGYSVNSYTRNSYGHHGHGYRYWPYAAAAAYAYGSSYASSSDGCYHVSAYKRYGYRRVLVCDGD